MDWIVGKGGHGVMIFSPFSICKYSLMKNNETE